MCLLPMHENINKSRNLLTCKIKCWSEIELGQIYLFKKRSSDVKLSITLIFDAGK